MAAIAGLLASRPASADDCRRAVRRMLAASPHRGTTISMVQLGCCVLATCVTQDDAGSGLAATNDLAVAYTGSIDNVKELAAVLPSVPGDASVSELLLACYRTYGEDLPARLRGVFAVLLTDGHHLIGFRDHLGFRSLFYRLDSSGIYAASEAKQIVAGSKIVREPDLEAVERIFYDFDAHQTSAALKGVSRLPKGSLFVSDGNQFRTRAYWDPLPLLDSPPIGEADLRERFEAVMSQAVARILTGSDVVSLSGGIDSPAVAAFAAREHRRRFGTPLSALSIVYPNQPSVDERRYVELISSYLQIPLHTYEQHARPLDDVLEWTALLDGPATQLSLPECAEHYQRSRALGFRTILTGHLAEAVFDERSYLLPYLLVQRKLPVLWRHVKGQRSVGRSYRAIARDLAGPLVPRRLARAYRSRRSSARTAGVPHWLDARQVRRAASSNDTPVRRRWAEQQLLALRRTDIWLEADEICQARYGVEVRRPWADVDLWEFFLRLPVEVKFGDVQRKGLVRRLLRGKLPDEVLDRRDKTVFDEVGMEQLDYEALRTCLSNPRERITGVDYDRLADHLQRENLELLDLRWVTDLACVHAFLAQW